MRVKESKSAAVGKKSGLGLGVEKKHKSGKKETALEHRKRVIEWERETAQELREEKKR